MSLNIIEAIQKVSEGYVGALKVVGSKTSIDVFHDSVGDPMYGDINSPDVPMDQPTFYRIYKHRLFTADDQDIDATTPDEDASDDVVTSDDGSPDVIEWSNDPATTDKALSDYLVDVAGEDRRNWSRKTMVEKIARYVRTGSAD